MKKKKSNILAGVLAIFFGGMGVHKFYLGKPIQGIIYLIPWIVFLVFYAIGDAFAYEGDYGISLLFLFVALIIWFPLNLIAFIEGIIYLCNSEKFDAKYNKHLEEQNVSDRDKQKGEQHEKMD
jgi:TM2 domain-containing membrane protein YozV